jgi:ribonuclease E
MANKMLIDSTHPEETRVVVLRGNRVEEFDYENANRKPLRGNIYLAKVTRVEPSLQAAFVEYGGNRHGFLAFSEIHPDYYQIPVADRQALIAEEERAEREAAKKADTDSRKRSKKVSKAKAKPEAESEAEDDEAEAAEEGEAEHGEDSIEAMGSDDALEEVPERPRQSRRQYKIQEVIRRRQILLVQVVKEERGTKGAALTTYLSLAGRYSVLMPNTGRGGGISRKITNAQDRKRLKTIAQDLEVPDGMGVILRTAGAARTKTEIKRDFEYLMRLWESVREVTLKSSAPALVYEEGSLIKRSIRDLYSKDIEEILVAGDDGYREAKDFMRMLMPSHAKQVKTYKEVTPLFARHGVESQLDAMFSNIVNLKSGGYLVMNPTEALVAIDVNSGRSTREHNIEDTALKTNLEAADEVARQLRLRDLAGLVVIDFIDMEEKRNNRAVEKRLKEALKNDRARIQVGQISPFGLMEMSRQRIRTGVVESSSIPCPTCGGSGQVRATPSVALQVLRLIEDQLIRSASHNLTVKTKLDVAFYILNNKRLHLRELENRFHVTITVVADDTLGAHRVYVIERGEPAQPVQERGLVTGIRAEAVAAPIDDSEDDDLDNATAEDEDEDEEDKPNQARGNARHEGDERRDGESESENRRRRRRRRRRGRGQRGDENGTERQNGGVKADAAAHDDAEHDDADETLSDGEHDRMQAVMAAEALPASEPTLDAENEADDEAEPKKRKRGRRGGKRLRRDEASEAGDDIATADEASIALPPEQDGAGEAAKLSAKTDQASAEAAPAAPPAPRAPIVSNPEAYAINQEEPSAPKRGGWWAKAKQAIGGQ